MNRTESHKQEVYVAHQLMRIYPKTHRQPGSGNQAHSPNDIHVPQHFFIECKCTVKKSITVQLQWLHTMIRTAMSFGVRGVIALRFVEPRKNTDLFVVEADYFYHLLECEKQIDAGNV